MSIPKGVTVIKKIKTDKNNDAARANCSIPLGVPLLSAFITWITVTPFAAPDRAHTDRDSL